MAGLLQEVPDFEAEFVPECTHKRPHKMSLGQCYLLSVGMSSLTIGRA